MVEKDHNSFKRPDGVHSLKLRAGRRRTYFFDVRTTKSNDYYLTITESKKRFDDDGYDRHKIFVYKEDFNKFLGSLTETIDYVKEELMPDYDFDEFAKRQDEKRKEWEERKRDEVNNGAYENSNHTNQMEVGEISSADNTEVPEPENAQEEINEEDLKWGD